MPRQIIQPKSSLLEAFRTESATQRDVDLFRLDFSERANREIEELTSGYQKLVQQDQIEGLAARIEDPAAQPQPAAQPAPEEPAMRPQAMPQRAAEEPAFHPIDAAPEPPPAGMTDAGPSFGLPPSPLADDSLVGISPLGSRRAVPSSEQQPGSGVMNPQPASQGSLAAAMPTAARGAPTAPGEIESYIRSAAARRGIDPDTAIRVVNAEGGLVDPVRQSDYVYQGRREQSYGPLQLNIDGGVGSAALKAGIDPRDPAQWRQAVDFGLDEVSRSGWGQWHGAARVGIGERQGIGTYQGPVPAAPAAQPAPAPAAAPVGMSAPVRAQTLQTPNLGGPRTGTKGIVVHSTRGQGAAPEAELQGTLSWFANPASQVSAHAVIGADGSVYTVGDLDRQTWHAGENNADRLGIELVQSAADNERGVPFTDAQYRSLAQLTADWSRRYGFGIDRQSLVGHEELEQGRRSGKTDPGKSFSWDRYVQEARALAPGTPARVAEARPAMDSLHPNAAAAFERANGRPPSIDEAAELAMLGYGRA